MTSRGLQVIHQPFPCLPLKQGTGEGFPSSHVSLPTVPLPIPRRIPRRCLSRFFAPSMAFTVTHPARLPLVPRRGAITRRQDSLYAADRSVAPSNRLLTLRFDARRFPPTPAACYRAPWRLPGPDLHRLADVSLRATRSVLTISFHCPCALWAHYEPGISAPAPGPRTPRGPRILVPWSRL